MELSSSLPPDYEERMVAASVDCAGGKGDGEACHAVGEFLSVIRRDYAGARDTYAKNCASRSHGASCFGIGRLLLGGKGGDADEGAAREAFARGCGLGHGPACHHLGLLDFKAGDDAAAIKHLGKACDGGNAASCYTVGGYLLKNKRPADARPMLERACDDGHAPACHNLAVMFKTGDGGVERDAAKFATYAAKTRALVDAAGAARGVKVA